MAVSSSSAQGQEFLGALAMWVGWYLCAVFAAKKFNEAWWSDPQKRAEMVRNCRAAPRLPNGEIQWQVMLREHPSTISEMMGKSESAQGAVAKSICLPGLLLCVIGGFLINSAGPSISSAALAFCRAAGPGIGLIMVVYTPVLTLLPDSVLTRVSSELEDTWWMHWMSVHLIGFMAMFASVILIELPVAIYDVWWWSSATAGWPAPERYMRLILSVLCGFSAFCMVPALVWMMSAKDTKTPDTASFKSFLGELAALKACAFVHMFQACSCLLEPTGQRSWMDVVLLAGITCYTLVKFCFEVLQTLVWLAFWEKANWNEVLLKYRKEHEGGPIQLGMMKLSGNSLMFLRIVQAGQAYAGDELAKVGFAAFGSSHPKITQFLVRPYDYMAVEATDFHHLSREDLQHFNSDFTHVLQQLGGPETIYFPFGKKCKFARKLPFLRVSCKDYAAEVAGIDKNAKANNLSYKYGEDEKITAYNITEMVMADPRTAFLATTPFIKAIAEGDCFGMYEFFGEFLGDSTPPFVPLLTRPGRKPPDGLSYEVQLRGITAAPPVVILHVTQGQKMPADWSVQPSKRAVDRKRTVDDDALDGDQPEAKKAK